MPRTKSKTIANGVMVGNPDQQSIILSANQVKEIKRSPSEERDLQHLLDAAVSPDDWISIFSNAREQALSGDKFSIMLLMKYKFGNPAPALPPKQSVNARIEIVEVGKTDIDPDDENQ